MATLKDLSRKLGLSVTQVSRALNGHDDVNEETRNRVLAAAREMNYSPNISARKLASGRSGIVGLVLEDSEGGPSGSLFVQMIKGLSRSFSERGMQFVLHMANPQEDSVSVHERLINGGSLDGFVLIEPQARDARIDYLRRRNIPFVLHGRHRLAPDYPFFDIDNDAVGYRLTRLLAEAGHRRIAFFNGRLDRTYATQRLEGHRRALSEFSCDTQAMLHQSGRMTEAHGLLATIRLFEQARHRPTAIICGNYLIAKGVFSALQALGLSVPGDVSVVAHDDDLPKAELGLFPVPLTVTRASLSESWVQLSELLVERIKGTPTVDLQRIGEVALIQRQSVAAPPRNA